MRRGVWLYPGAAAGALVDAVVAADALGLDEVWIADEGVAREPSQILAAAAYQTSRVRLAVGITSPLLRHLGAIASTFATLDELSEGRAVLGLGVGGHESLEPFGLAAERPVKLLKDAIVMARAVFAGVACDGYEPPSHRMPARSVPIWVGARGPQLVRVAGRLADGVFLSGCSAEQHDQIVGNARSVNSEVGLALYQSASDVDTRNSVRSWGEVGEVLAEEAERFVPDAVGINLVDLMRSGQDPVALVERAAAVLEGLS